MVSLVHNTSISPTFTPDMNGIYVLSLVVNDGQASSAIDTVVIDAHLPGSINLVLEAYIKASNTEPAGLSSINDFWNDRCAKRRHSSSGLIQ